MNSLIMLDGSGLSILDVRNVARHKFKVDISEEAKARLELSRKVVFSLADKGIPIYGFTVGVGWNKDKKVFGKYFEEYNRNLIYCHSCGTKDEMSEEEVRSVLLARLNTFLTGRSGVQPEVAYIYADFLNHEIHPIIPARGSIGQADITTLSHIGLAIMGEGEVIYKGIRMSAKDALLKSGISEVILGPKDGLAIVSSNAQAAGPASVLLCDIENLILVANNIYALSLEGLNGNVTPLNEKVNELRKMNGQIECARQTREALRESSLLDKDITKTLQDALSFRDATAIHGAVLDSLNYVKGLMEIHLNATEDNPCVIFEDEKIISCQNFEATNWVVGLEMLAISLSHMSKSSCFRTIKLSNPEFTKLTRFLTPSEGDVLGFQTIQKTFTSLDAEIRNLINPSSIDYYSVAGEIEDHANNSPIVVRKLQKIVDNLYYIFGIELMHAAQAIDLRGNIELGSGSKVVYSEYRKHVAFLSKDRPLTPDISNSYDVIKKEIIFNSIINRNK